MTNNWDDYDLWVEQMFKLVEENMYNFNLIEIEE
jgi:hypothetical protein